MLKGADTLYVPPVQYSLGMRSNNKATQVMSDMAWSRADPPWSTESMQCRMDIFRCWNHPCKWVGGFPSDRMKVFVLVRI